MTAFGNIFFALVQDGWSYWSYGFPSAIIIVFGADFVFSSGTLFIAKCARPHEQSVAGAMFSVMTQVRIEPSAPPSLRLFLFGLLPLRWRRLDGLFVRWKCRTRADVDRRDAWAAHHHPALVDQVPRLVPCCLIPRRPCTLIRAGRRKLTRFG